MKTPRNCVHLNLEVVLEIHAEAIGRFGGSEGLRDRALLESAVATPQATFGGESPYKDAVDVASAYLFSLCGNHPFIDGNKRVALGACLVFLQLNGIEPVEDGEQWEAMTLAVASGELSRDALTKQLRKLVK